MKSKLTIAIISLALVLSLLTACSNATNENATSTDATTSAEGTTAEDITTETDAVSDYEAIYAHVLDNAYRILSESDDEYEATEDEYGIWQATIGYSSEESLSNIGYAFKDIGGDETPELLITYLEDDGSGKYLLEICTIKYGIPFSIADGSARNSYALTNDGEVFNCGSNGASSQVYAVYGFNDNNDFACKQIWFSEASADDPETILCYYNGTGAYDKDNENTVQITEEQFGEISEQYGEKLVTFDATPFKDYTPTGTAKITFGDTVNADFAENIEDNFTEFNVYNACEGDDTVTVIFYDDNTVRNFEFFALENTEVDGDGNLVYDRNVLYSDSILAPETPLKVNLTFGGDMPEWGISYTSSTGETVTKLLSISGKDGSLLLTDN